VEDRTLILRTPSAVLVACESEKILLACSLEKHSEITIREGEKLLKNSYLIVSTSCICHCGEHSVNVMCNKLIYRTSQKIYSVKM
jgi:hypothetical protein